VAVIRPHVIVGAGRLGLLAILFDWVARGRRIPLVGSGENRFQMLAVEDLAEAVRLATSSTATGVFNVGGDPVPTVRDLLGALCAHAATGARVLPLPGSAVRPTLALLDRLRLSPLGTEHYLVADRDYVLDTTRARTELGWTPRIPMQQALCAAYDAWLARRGQPGSDIDFPDEGLLGLIGRWL
jgi:dTDP-glucose 4,6-dehydratase